MKKLSVVLSMIAIFIFFTGLVQTAFACSDIFINHPNAHIEARSMDFGMNIAIHDTFGFIG